VNIALSSSQKAFVERLVTSGQYVDASDVVRAAVRLLEARQLGQLQDSDIMSLALLVMMESAKSAREDLKATMAEVRAINAAKEQVRQTLAKMKRDRVTNSGAENGALDFSKGLGSERAYHAVPLPQLDADAPGGVRYVATDTYPGRLTTKDQICAAVDVVGNALDTLAEMGEMESLRLQMAMDRLSKMMSTLSNAMKKISGTDEAITQNLK
jgi:putative addiction module CopG family antidote